MVTVVTVDTGDQGQPQINFTLRKRIIWDWRKLLGYIAAGYDSRVIAAKMGIAVATLYTRLGHIREALDTNKLPGATALATSLELIELPQKQQEACRRARWGELSPLQHAIHELRALSFTQTVSTTMLTPMLNGKALKSLYRSALPLLGVEYDIEHHVSAMWVLAGGIKRLHEPSPLERSVLTGLALGDKMVASRLLGADANEHYRLSDRGIALLCRSAARKLNVAPDDVVAVAVRDGWVTL